MTSVSRVLIIGIDGLDANLLQLFQSNLPNFSKLMKKWPLVKMQSVFPPDSPTAWASIFTGLNPAKHGIVSFKDPLSRSKVGDYVDKVGNIAGRTFWDHAGKYGRKCCVLFPHLAYPPWPVNGILVSRTTEVDIRKFDIKTYPADFSLGCNPVELKPITSFPINIGQVIQPTKQLILNEVKFGERLLEGSDCEVFFIYFSSLDNIEHIFWMAFDETHPGYSKLNPYRDVISDFYNFYDEQVIGTFMKAIGSDTALMVLSDHGHGLRPCNLVNINEFLARAGLLKTKIKSSSLSDISYLKESVKRRITGFINEKRVAAKFASRFLSLFPKSLEMYTGSSPIDWNETSAYLCDSSAGLKAYSYAGIRVKKGFSSSSYEQIRKSVIELLMRIKDPKSSENLVEWAIKREELYEGPFISNYPDVVFKLRDTWGVGWEANGPSYGSSLSHKLFSGTHKQGSAVFLLDDPNGQTSKVDNPALTDVTPTILSMLSINDPNLHRSFDGKSILV